MTKNNFSKNINKVMQSLIKPKVKTTKKLRGGQPSNKVYYKAVDSSYNKKAFDNINGFEKIFDGETLDAFLKDNEIIVGVRGTLLNVNDLKADVNIISNNLKNSKRFQNDLKQFEQVIQRYPPSNYKYYLSGHSLGGAIVAELKRMFPFIQESVVFNSASQPIDLTNQDPNIKYKYIDKDPLYNITGKAIKNKEVYPFQQIKPKSFFGRIGATLTPTAIQAHRLNQFENLVGNGKQKIKIKK